MCCVHQSNKIFFRLRRVYFASLLALERPGRSADESGRFSRAGFPGLCGELMLNFIVQVGALFLLTKWVLYVVFWRLFLRGASKLTSSLWVGVMNECFRSIELKSCDFIGGNTQLDFEWTLEGLPPGTWLELVLLRSLEITACPFWAYQQYTPPQGHGKGQCVYNCPLDYLFDISVFRAVIKNDPRANLEFNCQINWDRAVITP